MPLVIATLRAEPSPDLTRQVAIALTDATVGALGKERERTTVIVQYVPAAQWQRGGVPATGGFFVQARVTGVHGWAQKSRFVREVNDRLAALLRAPGYVAVSETPADDWGYAGETQAARYAEASA